MNKPTQGASAPIPFDFNNHAVRVILRGGEPWFVAKDVCDALGYKNTSDAIATHLDDDERYSQSLERGGNQAIINESGLYALVLRSRKPQARKFARWVTGEVLPSIRKTGQYSAHTSGHPQVEFQPTPAYMKAVNDAAVKYVTQMWAYQKTHPDIPKLEMPGIEVVHGLLANLLRNRKFLVYLDYDFRAQIQPLGEDCQLVHANDLKGAKELVDALDVHGIFRMNLLVTQRFFDLAADRQSERGVKS